eukprot:SM000087S23330  [mRNA]  locus=s87:64711:65349:+ [translate_table: standard]
MCPRRREDRSHDLLRDGMQGVFIEAGYKVAVEHSSMMPPVRGADGQLHTRRADLVAIPPGGSPRIIADVVTADCVDFANPSKSAVTAGHAVALAARGKERKYADHPPGDEFAALAIDVHGACGSGWLDLLQRLARQAMERRPGLPEGLPGFNAAGSLAQVFRMRLSVSLQRSLAHAVHSRAGRALVAASGSRLPASFPASSYSDLMLLTCGY